MTGRSQELEIGRDFTEAGDVLVSEIIGNDFLSEGVLAAVADARRRLLNSDAQVIPASASVRVALAGGAELEQLLSTGVYDGLDLRAFDTLRPAVLPVPEAVTLTPLSEAIDTFNFDFTQETSFAPERRSIGLAVTAAGQCYGVVQWIRLHLDAETTFKNAPFGSYHSHWEPTLYTFPRPIEVMPGDIIRILAMHDVGSLMITLETLPTK